MSEMHNFNVTSLNKQSKESLSHSDSHTNLETLTFDNVRIFNEHMNECEENKDGEVMSKTEEVKTLTSQDNNFNKDTIILNQEIYENANIANHEVNNHSNEISTFSRNNGTWSFKQEFDLYLKEYKEKYDNYSLSTTMGSQCPVASGTQQFVDGINTKYENSKQLLGSSNLCGNSENYLPRPSSSNIDMTIGNNMYTKDSCYSGDVENWVASISETRKTNNALNTEIVLNYNDEVEHYTYEFLNDFNLAVKRKKDIANNVEKDNTISVNSNNDTLNTEIVLNCNDEMKQCTYEYLNDVNLAVNRDTATVEEKDKIVSVGLNSDFSRNYSVSSIGSMENICLDEFEADIDCEGYHSSDFEFIDETEAGIINKSYFDIKHNNFKDDTFEPTEDDNVNFDEAGPSWLKYDRLESTSPSFHSSYHDSGAEELNNNHVIPEGEQLYELFSEPWAVFNFEAENKAFYSNRAMHFDVDNIGFNVGLLQQRQQENEVDDAVKQEALENAKKILTIYPVENAKRRRRRF